MADLNKAMTYLLPNEGGYVDNPNDHGGCTNHGITKISLAAYRHAPVTCDDIKRITIAEVTAIYRVNYWDALRLDLINHQGVATALFDIGVLRGIGTSRMYAHWVCSKLNRSHINDCMPDAFISLFAKRARDGFDHIVASHPSQHVFLKGWHARADRLLTLV